MNIGQVMFGNGFNHNIFTLAKITVEKQCVQKRTVQMLYEQVLQASVEGLKMFQPDKADVAEVWQKHVITSTNRSKLKSFYRAFRNI